VKLLFVCVENSCRSQMAEAFARVRDEIERRVRELLDALHR
jgi:protein-tyrosine-phosphatase